MTSKQKEHINNICKYFKDKAVNKYKKGAKEHGGNLWEVEGLIDMALDEVIDQFIYLTTLRQQIIKTKVKLGKRIDINATQSPPTQTTKIVEKCKCVCHSDKPYLSPHLQKDCLCQTTKHLDKLVVPSKLPAGTITYPESCEELAILLGNVVNKQNDILDFNKQLLISLKERK
jgi:hypothetical protein